MTSFPIMLVIELPIRILLIFTLVTGICFLILNNDEAINRVVVDGVSEVSFSVLGVSDTQLSWPT